MPFIIARYLKKTRKTERALLEIIEKNIEL